jgi:hypothetical protein
MARDSERDGKLRRQRACFLGAICGRFFVLVGFDFGWPTRLMIDLMIPPPSMLCVSERKHIFVNAKNNLGTARIAAT